MYEFVSKVESSDSPSNFFIYRTCLECKQEFKYPINKRTKRMKFCSPECRIKFKSKYRDNKKQSLWALNNKLMVKGKRIIVRKRIFQGYCELCGKVIEGKEQPHWHHWDDNHPEQGIWVDARCHRLCEAIDDFNIELIDRYKTFKENIIKGENK